MVQSMAGYWLNTPDRNKPIIESAPSRKVIRAMSTTPARRRLTFTAIAGLLAATFDITFAFTFYGLHGATPSGILTHIASALVGPTAKTLGVWSVLLGGFLHYFIALCAAFAYLFASRYFQPLVRHPLPYGAAFGVAMYVFMNFAVIPLSKLTFHLPPLRVVIGELCSHILLFGLVIAVGVARGSRKGEGKMQEVPAGAQH
jgi:hypothetical protein